MTRSSICVASGRPAPRYAAVDVVFVTTDTAWKRIFGKLYTPWLIICVSTGRKAPMPGYAPASATTSTSSPTNVPSASSPSLVFITIPRPWTIDTMFSLRPSVHLTGRPSARASSLMSTCSV